MKTFGHILALNCGSSSVKYQLYDWDRAALIDKGAIERIGEPGGCPDHKAALYSIIEGLRAPVAAAAHRVVHGGEKFRRSVVVTPEVLGVIRSVRDLAPLHNPPNIAGIEAALAVMPDAPQVAVFDTAFHQTMPEHAYLYAVPWQWREKYGVRRYGFHGTSHLYVSRRAAVLLGRAPARTNVITLHIGNGVSVTAVKNGRSSDTSMGFTPLEGAIMGTRSGDIDPAIIPFIARKEGLSATEIETILNKRSGLLAITGQFTDRRDIARGAGAGDKRCQLAIEMECYRLKKYVGAYAAAMGGVDAVVFTAGVGETQPLIREKTLSGLEFMGIRLDSGRNARAVDRKTEMEISADDSPVKVFVIPTNEEIVLIEDAAALVAGGKDGGEGFTYSFETSR